eukprot:jgi/Undpi1/3233/HiC_scaffold_15.g06607.m1
MADSPQVQPLPGLVEGGFADLGAAAAAAADPAAAAHSAAAVQDVSIHSHRLGRVLHILDISVAAGLTTPCFMDPLGVGGDVFFTQVFRTNAVGAQEWHADSGVAIYAPRINDVMCPAPLPWAPGARQCGMVRDRADVLEVCTCPDAKDKTAYPSLEDGKVLESGRYVGVYVSPGWEAYEASVTQLLSGGLDAKFWKKQWMVGTPIVHRIDPELSFNWGLSPVTSFGRGPVSTRWEGKLLAPTSELFHLFLRAQGGVRLFLDHKLVIDAWEANLRTTKERMVPAYLIKDNFHDIIVEYKEEGGPASLQANCSKRVTRDDGGRHVSPDLRLICPAEGAPTEATHSYSDYAKAMVLYHGDGTCVASYSTVDNSVLMDVPDVGWHGGLAVPSHWGGQLGPGMCRPHVAGAVCGPHDEDFLAPVICVEWPDSVACRGALLLRPQATHSPGAGPGDLGPFFAPASGLVCPGDDTPAVAPIPDPNNVKGMALYHGGGTSAGSCSGRVESFTGMGVSGVSSTESFFAASDSGGQLITAISRRLVTGPVRELDDMVILTTLSCTDRAETERWRVALLLCLQATYSPGVCPGDLGPFFAPASGLVCPGDDTPAVAPIPDPNNVKGMALYHGGGTSAGSCSGRVESFMGIGVSGVSSTESFFAARDSGGQLITATSRRLVTWPVRGLDDMVILTTLSCMDRAETERWRVALLLCLQANKTRTPAGHRTRPLPAADGCQENLVMNHLRDVRARYSWDELTPQSLATTKLSFQPTSDTSINTELAPSWWTCLTLVGRKGWSWPAIEGATYSPGVGPGDLGPFFAPAFGLVCPGDDTPAVAPIPDPNNVKGMALYHGGETSAGSCSGWVESFTGMGVSGVSSTESLMAASDSGVQLITAISRRLVTGPVRGLDDMVILTTLSCMDFAETERWRVALLLCLQATYSPGVCPGDLGPLFAPAFGLICPGDDTPAVAPIPDPNNVKGMALYHGGGTSAGSCSGRVESFTGMGVSGVSSTGSIFAASDSGGQLITAISRRLVTGPVRGLDDMVMLTTLSCMDRAETERWRVALLLCLQATYSPGVSPGDLGPFFAPAFGLVFPGDDTPAVAPIPDPNNVKGMALYHGGETSAGSCSGRVESFTGMGVSGVSSTESLIAASDSGGQLITAISRRLVTGPVCGLDDMVILTTLSCMDRSETERWHVALLLCLQATYSPGVCPGDLGPLFASAFMLVRPGDDTPAVAPIPDPNNVKGMALYHGGGISAGSCFGRVESFTGMGVSGLSSTESLIAANGSGGQLITAISRRLVTWPVRGLDDMVILTTLSCMDRAETERWRVALLLCLQATYSPGVCPGDLGPFFAPAFGLVFPGDDTPAVAPIPDPNNVKGMALYHGGETSAGSCSGRVESFTGMGVSGVSSTEGMVAAGDSGGKLVAAISRRLVTGPVCGLDDMVILTTVSYMDRAENERWRVALLLSLQANSSNRGSRYHGGFNTAPDLGLICPVEDTPEAVPDYAKAMVLYHDNGTWAASCSARVGSSSRVDFSGVCSMQCLVATSDSGGQIVPVMSRPDIGGLMCGLDDAVVKVVNMMDPRKTVAWRVALLLRLQVKSVFSKVLVQRRKHSVESPEVPGEVAERLLSPSAAPEFVSDDMSHHGHLVAVDIPSAPEAAEVPYDLNRRTGDLTPGNLHAVEISPRRHDASLAATMRLTLSFLAALVGRLGWFLAVTAAACMMLVIPVVILLSSIAHLEDDLLDDTNQPDAGHPGSNGEGSGSDSDEEEDGSDGTGKPPSPPEKPPRQTEGGVVTNSPRKDSLAVSLGALFEDMEQDSRSACNVDSIILNAISSAPRLIPNEQADAGEVLLQILSELETQATKDKDDVTLRAIAGMQGEMGLHCKCLLCKEPAVGNHLANAEEGSGGGEDGRGAGEAGREQRVEGRRGVGSRWVEEEEEEGEGGGGGGGGGGQKSVALSALLEKVFSTVTVDSCNECRGNYGGKSQPNGRSMSTTLVDCPDQLLLSLKRFTGDGGARRGKLSHLVEIPPVLEAGRFTELGRQSEVPVTYDLKVVVHHSAWARQSGDVEHQQGHYVAFVCTGDDHWIKYNDSTVSTSNAKEALSNGVYLVSYAKRVG